MVTCYLGIGSNLGDRSRNIKIAQEKINHLPDTSVVKSSQIIETEPQGGPRHQPKFLNAVFKIKTGLSAKALLKGLKEIELSLGRKRVVRFGPRVIDLDILLYGNEFIATQSLQVPHPRLKEREFVLRSLLEVL
jgi:2-amino-4-hydroxy-6-hydroxymethyldihydropteridine diphosphokinase